MLAANGPGAVPAWHSTTVSTSPARSPMTMRQRASAEFTQPPDEKRSPFKGSRALYKRLCSLPLQRLLVVMLPLVGP